METFSNLDAELQSYLTQVYMSMSLQKKTSDLVAEKLLPKGSANTTGLRKRPQFEQTVNYLSFGQETVVYPDRQAKLIRNHPFMTQLDFFDTQEDQQRAWEEQTKTKCSKKRLAS